MCLTSGDQLGLFSALSGASLFLYPDLSFHVWFLLLLVLYTEFCSHLHMKENIFFLISDGCCSFSPKDLNTLAFSPTVLPALNSHHVTENLSRTLSGTLSQCGDPLSITCRIFRAQPTAVKLLFFPLLKTAKCNKHSSVWCLFQFAEHPWTEMTPITVREDSSWKQQLFIAPPVGLS